MKFKNVEFLKLTSLILLTFVLALSIYDDFIVGDKLYLLVGDAIASYFPYYYFMSEMVSSFLIEGNFSFYSFKLGTGKSIYNAFINVLDPFMFPFYIFSGDIIPKVLGYVQILKILFASVFTYLLCTKWKFKFFTSFILSLLYSFSGYMLLWSHHYQFGSYYAIIPFAIWALERLIQEKRWKLYVLSIFLLSIMSLYRFYAVAFLIPIYVTIRYYELNEVYSFKSYFSWVLRILAYSLLGIGIAAVIIIPLGIIILESPRTGGRTFSIVSQFLIPDIKVLFQYWFRSLSPIISNELTFDMARFGRIYEQPNIFLGMLPVLLLIYLPFIYSQFNYKNKRIIIILFSIISILIIFPFFGWFFSVFSAFNFRWNFILVFLIIYLLGKIIDFILRNSEMELKLRVSPLMFILLIISSVYVVSTIYQVDLTTQKNMLSLLTVPILFFLLYGVLVFKKNINNSRIRLTLVIILCIEMIVNGYLMNDYLLKNYEYLDINRTASHISYKDNSYTQIQNINEGLYRIDKSKKTVSNNDSLLQNFYGIQSYTSLQNAAYNDFLKTFNLDTGNNTIHNGFNNLASLYTLMNVKYIVGDEAPPSFSQIDKELYINDYYVPFGTEYYKVIPRSNFNTISQSAKEKVLLDTLVLEDESITSGLNVISENEAYSIVKETEIEIIDLESSFREYKVTKSKDNKSWILDSDGKYPRVVINTNENTYEGNGYSVNFTVESEQKSTGSITFYGQSKRISSFDIKKGVNNYSIFIDKKELDTLLLHIGNGKGEKFKLSNLRMLNKYTGNEMKTPLELFKSNNAKINLIDKNIEYVDSNDNHEIIHKISHLHKRSNNRDLNIRINIESNKNKNVKIYYSSEESVFIESNIIELEIEKGNKEYNFSVPHGTKFIKLILGSKDESYVINSVYIVEEDLENYYGDTIKNINSLDIKYFTEDKIIGDIYTQKDGTHLFLSIPYDDGWSIKVNGEKKKLLKTNIGFMSTQLDKGHNHIELRFIPKGFISGLTITIFSLIIFIVISFNSYLLRVAKKLKIIK